jgi:hypothetical protein
MFVVSNSFQNNVFLFVIFRKEIADSMQVAYNRLSVNDATKLLWFDNIQEFTEFANQVLYFHQPHNFYMIFNSPD